MSDLINALLNLSRIESERLSISRAPLDIAEFVAVTIKELEPLNLKFQKATKSFLTSGGRTSAVEC